GPPLRAAALPAAGQPAHVPGLHPRDGGPGPGVGRRTAVVVPVSEILVVAAISLAAASGVPGLFLPPRGRAGGWLAPRAVGGPGAIVAAGACGAVASVAVLLGGPARPLSLAWAVPGGRLAVEVDALSAAFVLPISLLAALGAVYGLAYWAQDAHRDNGRKLRAFYGAVTAGMLLQVIARNAVLFLAGLAIMPLASFLLVSTED